MVPIHKTAKRLNHHKFLSMLEKYLESGKIQLSGAIEFDETYVLESSKGFSLKRRKARHRGEPSKITLHTALSSRQTEQIVITLWHNVRIVK